MEEHTVVAPPLFFKAVGRKEKMDLGLGQAILMVLTKPRNRLEGDRHGESLALSSILPVREPDVILQTSKGPWHHERVKGFVVRVLC